MIGRPACASTDENGQPIPGASLDVWQNADTGFYAVQQPGLQPPTNLRGVYLCRSETHRCCSERVWHATMGSWNPVRVIVSLVYQVTRKLLSVPAVLLRRDATKDAELLVLRHENAVLRRQIKGSVRYESADRLWFAALSALIPRRRWARVFPATPATVLAWHRRLIARKGDFSKRRSRPGRPPTVRGEGVGAAAGRGESAVGLPSDPR